MGASRASHELASGKTQGVFRAVRYLFDGAVFRRGCNPILHGVEVTYPSEELSTECILALNELAKACDEFERREQTAWAQIAAQGMERDEPEDEHPGSLPLG